ncbi:potassium channel family protein [Streptomyces asoensis]|uniref:Trk system potassium uptake protein TrkA n=1 Tax=Streptomyces asoensis TaxID=249586 RepID=C1IC43_9ACTN|nr:TrkA family potassium uptake protein [Streptomyces asoensis]ABX24508.1 putative potassium uptake protein [Streptomyces asoensis]GGQ54608.1 potassium transporter TrkA [Streptomyces asoensis]GHI60777.1 potassium transporter TrkA [Streptomyces asoensis]
MNVLIAGAGRLGTQIAQVLSAARNDVTLIDTDDARLAELEGRVPVRLVAGDACEPALLEHSGVLTADLVIATTGEDEDNLVISLLAKRQFAVPRVAARVNDADNAWLFDERWGVDVAVPSATPLISLIEEATGATDTVALLRLSKAGVEVVETVITEQSRTAGRALGDVVLPPGTVVATIVRDGQPTVPEPTERLRPGDALLLVSHTVTENEIHAAFQ